MLNSQACLLDKQFSCTFCLLRAIACLPKMIILLAGDLIPWTFAHWTSTVKKLLTEKETQPVLDNQTGCFLSPKILVGRLFCNLW